MLLTEQLLRSNEYIDGVRMLQRSAFRPVDVRAKAGWDANSESRELSERDESTGRYAKRDTLLRPGQYGRE